MGKYKKKVGGRTYQNYTNASLLNAVKEIKMNKLSVRKVSEKYGIPRTTLYDYIKNKNNIFRKPGGQVVLSKKDEDTLVEGLITCSEWGFPLRASDVQILVKSYLDRSGRHEKIFKHENMPGVDWVRAFLKRNIILTQRLGENIKRVRAGVSKPILDTYFNNHEDVLRDVPATNIFNYDETNFSDDPGKKLVIVRRGVKHPEIIRDSSKTSTSVMFCASADGKIVPPYTVYKAAHLYPTWVEGGIPGARYNRNISVV